MTVKALLEPASATCPSSSLESNTHHETVKAGLHDLANDKIEEPAEDANPARYYLDLVVF
jgi:hypothetical protein